MNHSFLNWNLNDASVPASRRTTTNSSDVPFSVGNEMEELAWENDQLLVNGLGSGLTRASIPAKETWDNSRAAVGTLESIVNLATHKRPPPLPPPGNVDYDEINVPWVDYRTLQKPPSPTAVATSVTDALVPCGTPKEDVHIPEKQGIGTGDVSGSARVKKRKRLGGNTVSCQRSLSASKQVYTVDTCTQDKDSSGFGVATASFCSEKPASTNNNTTSLDDNDESVSLTHSQGDKYDKEKRKKKETSERSSLSTKRSRAAAIHNQSERKRRETINQKMKTLQKMVPNSSKTDKASMLDEVIEYVRQLQAQAQMMTMMGRMMSMSMGMGMPASVMMPFAMAQHMSMMPPMNMNMNMGMDMSNIMACQNLANMSPLINPSAAAFMPMAAPSPWDLTADQTPSSAPMGSGDT